MAQRVDVAPAPGMQTQTGLLLSVLEDTTQEWREELGFPPDAFLAWQPFAGGHSIGGLLLHMADAEAYWLHEVAGGQARSPEEKQVLLSEETDQYNVRWPVPPPRPLAWFLAQQDAIRVRTRQTLLAINDPEHVAKRGDREFTLRWLLNHVISHEAYHGGQAVLLCLMQQAAAKT